MTDPHPDGLGVSTCIKLALKDSKIERDEVGAEHCPLLTEACKKLLPVLPCCCCHAALLPALLFQATHASHSCKPLPLHITPRLHLCFGLPLHNQF